MRYYHDLYNDKFFNEIVFKNKTNGYFVEIGGLDGIMHSQSYFFEKNKNWNGILVEPNINYHEEIDANRICDISHDAISDTNGKSIFCIKSEPAFSSLKNTTRDFQILEVLQEIDVTTLTLVDLLKKFKSPNVIDFVSIDVEGVELPIIEKFIKTNKKYSVTSFAIETHLVSELKDLFKDTSYVKVKNPFLSFLKHHHKYGFISFNRETGMFCDVFGNIVNEDYDLFDDVRFEHYFIDMNYIVKNPHLKKYIINE